MEPASAHFFGLRLLLRLGLPHGFAQPALVRAQNRQLSEKAVGELRLHFNEQPPTFGWPGSTQHRFAGKEFAILIWADGGQADWFVGARDGVSLESALRTVWQIDDIGQSLYDCGEIGKAVLDKIRGRHNAAVNRSRR